MSDRPESRSQLARETVSQVRNILAKSTRPNYPAASATSAIPSAPAHQGYDFAGLPEYEQLRLQKAAGEIVGLANPFYRQHDVRAADTTVIDGRSLINFSSYDYLGLNGDPRVVQAAKDAIDEWGTSVSASRLTAGERPIHRDLERALADLHGVEAALTFVSGHATNVSVIGGLLGADDLILLDAFVHNSVVEGAKLSGAKRILFPHGDMEALERSLRLNRAKHRRTLIVVEGLYSMDGDVPDLASLIKLKQRYGAWLMVDEAHSVGVLGSAGRGIAEEQGVDPRGVDIWMGTLSKSLAATGGYIAGPLSLIEILKYTSPGCVFSVGLSPPLAAAALAALRIMGSERWRLEHLRTNGRTFLEGAKERGLDTGLSIGASVTPIIVGNSPVAVILAQRLQERGFNVIPIIFPGVPENQARLRFFITSRHSLAQIGQVLDATVSELEKARSAPSFVQQMAATLGE